MFASNSTTGAPLQAPTTARGWRRLPLADLEMLALAARREAARRHLTAAEWRLVDRMRKRVTALQREQV
jgi:hypothetical protein